MTVSCCFLQYGKIFLRDVKEEKAKYKLGLHAFSGRRGSGAEQMDMMWRPGTVWRISCRFPPTALIVEPVPIETLSTENFYELFIIILFLWCSS